MEQWRTSELTDAAESYARALEQARRQIGAMTDKSPSRNMRLWAILGGIAAAAGVVLVGVLRVKQRRQERQLMAQDTVPIDELEITGGVQ